ncbi:TniB family NTP-binding protein [Streptomyces caniferus]|uniref:TniB family NTP-binding protein n=1 Tax=Streptomyces caniferus TaxID=285557 RepID=UPI0033D03390
MLLGRHQQTTALLEVGRTCHLAHTRKRPAPPGRTHQQIPVAYLLVPSGATAKTLAIEFARYLGIPVTTRMTQTQITEAVCHTYTQAGVRRVLIDEIHRLNPRTTTGAEATDLLKDLTERIRATFVDTGVDVPSTRRSPAYAAPNSPVMPASSPAAPSRPPRRHPPLDRPHHRHGERPRPDPAPTRHPPGTHPARSPATPPTSTSAPPTASAASPASSASSHYRHLRRHRTHHQENTRSHPARPPGRRTQAPPHPPTDQNGMMRT